MPTPPQLIGDEFSLDRPAAHWRRVIANLEDFLLAFHYSGKIAGCGNNVIVMEITANEVPDILLPPGSENRALWPSLSISRGFVHNTENSRSFVYSNLLPRI
jgi:hypothetical protein